MTWFDVEETEDFETIYAGDLDRAVLTDTALTGNAGMWVGWQATETLLLFYRLQAYGMLGDAASREDYMGKELTLVNGIGVRVSF